MPDLFGLRALKGEIDVNTKEVNKRFLLLSTSFDAVSATLKHYHSQMLEMKDEMRVLESSLQRGERLNHSKGKALFRKMGEQFGLTGHIKLFFYEWLNLSRDARRERELLETESKRESFFNERFSSLNMDLSNIANSIQAIQNSLHIQSSELVQTRKELADSITGVKADLVAVKESQKYVDDVALSVDNLKTTIKTQQAEIDSISQQKSNQIEQLCPANCIEWTIKNVSERLTESTFHSPALYFENCLELKVSFSVSLSDAIPPLPGMCTLIVSGPEKLFKAKLKIKISDQSTIIILENNGENNYQKQIPDFIFFSHAFNKSTNSISIQFQIIELQISSYQDTIDNCIRSEYHLSTQMANPELLNNSISHRRGQWNVQLGTSDRFESREFTIGCFESVKLFLLNSCAVNVKISEKDINLLKLYNFIVKIGENQQIVKFDLLSLTGTTGAFNKVKRLDTFLTIHILLIESDSEFINIESEPIGLYGQYIPPQLS